jgi:ribosomal-protein-alanine N-acetyltransferase
MQRPDSFPCLETPRLRLQQLGADDAASLLAIYRDTEHMKWYGIDTLQDLAAAEARIKVFAGMRRQANPGTPWAIWSKSGSAMIGTCGLFAWNRNWRKCSMGYELAKEAQGHGYMQEALTAAITWGLETMDLNRIEAQVHPNNRRSLALLRKLRFVEEGRLRQAAYWAGQYHDMLQYSLLRSDWIA